MTFPSLFRQISSYQCKHKPEEFTHVWERVISRGTSRCDGCRYGRHIKFLLLLQSNVSHRGKKQEEENRRSKIYKGQRKNRSQKNKAQSRKKD